MLNDSRVASLGFFKDNVCTTRINKEKKFKIKFQVLLKFAQILPDYTRPFKTERLLIGRKESNQTKKKSNKMFVFMAEIHKNVRIANSEDPNQTASSEAV